jgi:hypothetical protein
MISRRIARKPENDNYRRLADYIAAAGHTGEKALLCWCAGCWAGDDYELAIQEVVDTQALNTRTAKEKTYHLIVSFRPEDEVRLTPEVLKEIEAEFAKALGFEEHQRHCGVHRNTANLHMHMAYNMIHPEKLTRHEPFRDFWKRDQTCRDLEKKYGLAIENGRSLENTDSKLTPVAATVEAHTGQQSFDGYVKERRERILEALRQATGWEQVHAAFATFGMEIKPHGNGLIIKDRLGRHAVKASGLDRSLSLTKLTRRFGAYVPPGMAKEKYPQDETFTARPMHRGPERGGLYREYQASMVLQKAALSEVANREREDLESVRKLWSLEREKITQQFFGRHRYDLIKIARLREAEHRLQVGNKARAKREAVRKETPYLSWTDFLRWKAAQGDEVALAILRSKGELVEPEVNAFRSNQDRRQDIREKWIDQQLDLAESRDVTRRVRRGLLAVAKAHELAELEALSPNKKPLFVGFTSAIDSSGTVLITLANGGMIRDMGNQVCFSAHDETAREAAKQFAFAKWGKWHKLDKNVLRPLGRERGQELGR